MIKGRYKNAENFIHITKPIKYASIFQIEIKNRHLKFYYTRNGKKYWNVIQLKALFMKEDERKKREQIVEELLKRVKAANPSVKIIDERKKKVK